MGFHLWLLSDIVRWLSRLPTTCSIVCARGRCLQQSLPPSLLLEVTMPGWLSHPSARGHPLGSTGGQGRHVFAPRGPPSRAYWCKVLLRRFTVASRAVRRDLCSLARGWAPSDGGAKWAVRDSGLPATTTEWQILWNLFITSCYKVVYNTPLSKFFSSYRNLWMWPLNLFFNRQTWLYESPSLSHSSRFSMPLTFLLCSLSALLIFLIILLWYKPEIQVIAIASQEFPFCIWTASSDWICLERDCMRRFLQ